METEARTQWPGISLCAPDLSLMLLSGKHEGLRTDWVPGEAESIVVITLEVCRGSHN